MPTANTIGYIKAGNVDLAVAVDTSNNAIDLDQSVLISADGNQTMVSNLNQAALAHGLNGFQIQPGSSISLRSASGGFAKFAVGSLSAVAGTVNGVFLVAGSGGQIYYTPLGTGGSTYTGCARMKNITGYQVYLAGGGVVPFMEMNGSAELVVDDTAITNLYQDAGSSTLMYYATAISGEAEIGGGSCIIQRSITDGASGAFLRIGGAAQVEVSRIDANTTPPIADNIDMGSGFLKWKGGNIGLLRAYGSATLDLSDIPAAMSITTLKITAAVAQRSILKGRNFTCTLPSPGASYTVRCGMQDTIIN